MKLLTEYSLQEQDIQNQTVFPCVEPCHSYNKRINNLVAHASITLSTYMYHLINVVKKVLSSMLQVGHNARTVS